MCLVELLTDSLGGGAVTFASARLFLLLNVNQPIAHYVELAFCQLCDLCFVDVKLLNRRQSCSGPSTEGGMETNCLQVGPGGEVFPPP